MFEERTLNEPVDNFPNDTRRHAIWFRFGSIRARLTARGQCFAENYNRIISAIPKPFVAMNSSLLKLGFSVSRLLLTECSSLLLISLQPRSKKHFWIPSS